MHFLWIPINSFDCQWVPSILLNDCLRAQHADAVPYCFWNSCLSKDSTSWLGPMAVPCPWIPPPLVSREACHSQCGLRNSQAAIAHSVQLFSPSGLRERSGGSIHSLQEKQACRENNRIRHGAVGRQATLPFGAGFLVTLESTGGGQEHYYPGRKKIFQRQTYAPHLHYYSVETIGPKKLEFPQESHAGRRKES